jgi:hypothetical protein
MGVSPMSALVSISCAAALGRFPLVAGTWVQSDSQHLKLFCSKHFLRAADQLKYFDPLTATQVNIIESFILTILPSSTKLEMSLFSFCMPSLL